MRILLDERVPRRLRFSISTNEHQCETVPDAGFAGKTNGELLALAEMSFDIFVTLDKGFPYQQNLVGRRISILLVRAPSNNLADLLPRVPAILNAIAVIKAGEIVQVG